MSSGFRNMLEENRYWKKVRSRFTWLNFFSTPDQILLMGSGLLLLLILVVMPLGATLYYSFAVQFPVPASGYEFTVENYVTLFSQNQLYQITYDSLVFATGSTLLAVGIGLTAAIFEVKYLSGSRYRYFMLLPYGVPSVVGVIGWILLLGRNGLINQVLMYVFGLANPPINIFTMLGMIWVSGLHAAPIAFLLLSPSIRSVPKAIDEAALTAGASSWTVYRKIILPIIAPALLSVSIYLFARGMSLVTVPSVLGINQGIFTWGSSIPFLFLYGVDLNYSLAMAFAVVIMVFSGILMIIYYRAIAKAEKYTTVTGVGDAEPKVYGSAIMNKIASGFFLTFLFFGAVLPLLTVFWDSLIPQFQLTLSTLGNLTLDNYIVLFQGESQSIANFHRGLRNSIILGLVTPTIVMTISYIYSYMNQAVNLRLAGFVAWLASVPLAIPSIAVSLAFLITFIRTPLYGGALGMVLVIMANTAKEVPTGMRYTSPAITKIGKGNIEMAKVCGYDDIPTLKDIIVPLTKNDYIAGWMHIYVTSVREVTIPLLLMTAGSEVLGAQLLFLLVEGEFKAASTVGVVIAVLSVIPYILLQYYRANYVESGSH